MTSLEIVIVLSAGTTGCFFGILMLLTRERFHRRLRIKKRFISDQRAFSRETSISNRGPSALALRLMQNTSLKIRDGADPVLKMALWNFGLKDIEKTILQSGYEGLINRSGVVQSRFVLSIGAAFVGFLIGIVFSTELASLLAVICFVYGYFLPKRVLNDLSASRVQKGEKELSQMLEVIILGLNSGMGFDRALSFYQHYFDTSLSRTCASLQDQWKRGLISREKGLRSIAASYDSLIFVQVFENIIRSLRFGSALVDTLTFSSGEVRAIRKTKLEEKVAKAPIKMLVPVGTLILPAMLILVLGPVMLDLVQQF